MKSKPITSFVILSALLFSLSVARAEVPGQINYQGFLTDDVGAPIDGDVPMNFAIYDEVTGGNKIWQEGPITVPVSEGVYNVVLGQTAPITPELLDGPRWLEVIVDGEYLEPRERIVSALFAIKAETANTAIEAENADTVDGVHAAALEESAEIVAEIDAHESKPSVHHLRYTNAEAVAAAAAAGMEETAEIDADIASHAADAEAHHIKTTSFATLTDDASDAQIPDDITINYSAQAGYATAAGDANTVDGYEASEIIDAAADEARTPISSAPFTITEAGSYYLTQNLSVSGTDNAISVQISGVTIDLNGFTLFGDSSASSHGIYIEEGYSDVTVKNGNIVFFGFGIFTPEAGLLPRGHRILGVTCMVNIRSGILLNGNGHEVRNCVAIENNEDGIKLSNGGGHIVKDNIAYNNDLFGIWVEAQSLVDGNTAYNNGTNMSSCSTCTFGLNHAP